MFFFIFVIFLFFFFFFFQYSWKYIEVLRETQVNLSYREFLSKA